MTRTVVSAGLVLLLLSGSGCVYWRLSRLRGQLGQFSRHFTVEAAPGPTITFLKPVLRSGDVAWLLGLEPGEITIDGDTIARIWPLKKREAVDAEADTAARVDIRVIVRGDRIQSVSLPERFNQIIDQDRLEKSFAGSNTGPVERASQRTGWILANDIGIPTELELKAVLGPPGQLTETPTHRVVDYAYDVLRDGLEPGEGEPDATARFMFNRDRGRLVFADVRCGLLRVRVTSTDGRDYRIALQRGERK